jgi:hypothetical protein
MSKKRSNGHSNKNGKNGSSKKKQLALSSSPIELGHIEGQLCIADKGKVWLIGHNGVAKSVVRE